MRRTSILWKQRALHPTGIPLITPITIQRYFQEWGTIPQAGIIGIKLGRATTYCLERVSSLFIMKLDSSFFALPYFVGRSVKLKDPFTDPQRSHGESEAKAKSINTGSKGAKRRLIFIVHVHKHVALS